MVEYMQQEGHLVFAGGSFILEKNVWLSNTLNLSISYDEVIPFLRTKIPTDMCAYIHGEMWKMVLWKCYL